MSFIFQDKQLMNLLVRQGQATTPTGPYVGVGPQDFQAMRGLIANLEKQLGGAVPGAEPEVSSESGQDVDLISSHLENLGALIQFLTSNKITVDGKRISYAANENVKDPAYPLYKLEGSAGLLELANRTETVKFGYHLNTELLKKYMTTLQSQLSKNPNPVLQAQLNGIIQDANDQLDADVNSTYQEPDKTLQPGQELDRVPQNFNAQYPTADGTIPLTFGDISSDTDFNAWIQKNNVAVDGRAYRHPQYNKCALVNALNERARQKLSNATSMQEKYTYTVYTEQIPKLAGTLHCTLGSGNQPSGVEEQRGGQNNQAGSTATNKTAGLQQIVSTLPLRVTDIDFSRINNFLSVYRSVALSSDDPNKAQQMGTLINQLETYMRSAQQNTVGGAYTNFHMDGLTAQDLIGWATPPGPGEASRARGSATAIADYLYYIITNVSALIKNLYTSHADVLAQYPQLRQAIEQQVGGDHIPFGSSIAASNLNNLRAAKARLPQAGA